MTEIRTHKVATAAYERVAARAGADFKKQYGALTHKLPGMVLQNGLAQATGFLLAKGKDEHKAVMDDLLAVLRFGDPTLPENRLALHEQIIAAEMAKTMELTRRTLDAASWMKRYVQGVLGVDSTGNTSDADGTESDAPGGTE